SGLSTCAAGWPGRSRGGRECPGARTDTGSRTGTRRPRSAIQERRDAIGEGFGLLDLRMMPRRLDDLEARARNQGAVAASVRRLHDPVPGAPQHERRDRDPTQPALELRVVHIRMPAVEAERVPVAGVDDQLV